MYAQSSDSQKSRRETVWSVLWPWVIGAQKKRQRYLTMPASAAAAAVAAAGCGAVTEGWRCVLVKFIVDRLGNYDRPHAVALQKKLELLLEQAGDTLSMRYTAQLECDFFCVYIRLLTYLLTDSFDPFSSC